MLFKEIWKANDILELANIYKMSELLFAAVHIDLFTFLESPKTSDEIVDQLHLDPESIEVILMPFVATNLINQRAKTFQVNPSARTFLSRNSPSSLVNVIELERITRNKSNLNEKLIPKLKGEKVDKIEYPNIPVYMDAMLTGNYAGLLLARAVSKYLKKDVELKMLDLGCGPGAYSLAFCKLIPNLKACLVDRKEVLEFVKERFDSTQFHARISFQAKDFMTESLDGSYDLILLSNVCHFFSRFDLENLLKRLSLSLAKKGYIIVHDFFINGSLLPLFYTLDWLVNHSVKFAHTLDEMEDWLTTLGWKVVEKRNLKELTSSFLIFTK